MIKTLKSELQKYMHTRYIHTYCILRRRRFHCIDVEQRIRLYIITCNVVQHFSEYAVTGLQLSCSKHSGGSMGRRAMGAKFIPDFFFILGSRSAYFNAAFSGPSECLLLECTVYNTFRFRPPVRLPSLTFQSDCGSVKTPESLCRRGH